LKIEKKEKEEDRKRRRRVREENVKRGGEVVRKRNRE
jgi:hypothetical protein